jgi:hypothetical protein
LLAAGGAAFAIGPFLSCSNQVPTLSGSSPAVSSSGEYSTSYPAWKAFDSSTSSMWISETFETPAWIAYDFASFRKIQRYSITYSNGSITSRAPKDFQLQGWNGRLLCGIAWQLLAVPPLRHG